MLTRTDSYDTLYDTFAWDIPARYNMGVDVCDKHAARNADAPALIVTSAEGDLVTYSFGALRALSNQTANMFQAHGLARGERVAVLLPQSVEAALTHVAAWKAGLISVPLFTLFGEDALNFRLADSGAAAVVTDMANYPKIAALADILPDLKQVYVIDAGADGAGFTDFWGALGRASDTFRPVETVADDPGLIIYTSGTTGNPKGALHAHRCLLGHLPGVEMFHNFLGQPGDLMWTPADWAWIGGLMNTLMCAWHHGVPVIAHRARKYDPEEALGLSINEFYGQTECNVIVATCAEIMAAKPGAMGRPAPGHVVDVIAPDGTILPPGQEGEIACRAPDPVMLLEYWNNPAATQANLRDGWWRMGDTGYRDDEGYLWFVGRGDDVITSAGYRIGPGEIEDCLSRHPAVQLAAVIGVPDPIRTEAVKAFIVLMPGFEDGTATEQDIREFVKTRLSSHEYPRQIEFVDQLPMTATGKIKRKDLRDAERANTGGT